MQEPENSIFAKVLKAIEKYFYINFSSWKQIFYILFSGPHKIEMVSFRK